MSAAQCSVDSTSTATLTIRNQYPGPLNILWVAYNCSEITYFTGVAQSSTSQISTFGSHVWVARRPAPNDGSIVAQIVAVPGANVWTITSPAAVPSSSTTFPARTSSVTPPAAARTSPIEGSTAAAKIPALPAVTNSDPVSTSSTLPIGLIAGVIIACIVVSALTTLGVFYFLRMKRSASAAASKEPEPTSDFAGLAAGRSPPPPYMEAGLRMQYAQPQHQLYDLPENPDNVYILHDAGASSSGQWGAMPVPVSEWHKDKKAGLGEQGF